MRCRTESALPTFKLDRRGPVTPRRAPCAATPVNARPVILRRRRTRRSGHGSPLRRRLRLRRNSVRVCGERRATWATAIAPDCQQAAGGAYLPAVMVKESEFSLRSGEPIWFERPSDRGHPMRRAFCPACGSPLFLVNGANTAVRVLYAGSLDDPSWYRPSREIYVASAQPWCLLHPDLPHDEGMPRR